MVLDRGVSEPAAPQAIPVRGVSVVDRGVS